jgi:hypothetical protein
MAQTSSARPSSEASPLVGTWQLVSMSWTYPDGRSIEPWGKPAGRISYDANGNVMGILMHERRNQADGLAPDPATLSSYSAYFGTYQVDPANGIIRHMVRGSLNENASGELLQMRTVNAVLTGSEVPLTIKEYAPPSAPWR